MQLRVTPNAEANSAERISLEVQPGPILVESTLSPATLHCHGGVMFAMVLS
jgi:hypothetical protein